MLIQSKCDIRKCKHYIGIKQPDGTEASERHVCEAFPEKIPNDIAFGDNKHLQPTKEQDNKIVFEGI